MSNFEYQDIFELTEDKTEYRFLGSEHIKVSNVGDRCFVEVSREALSKIAYQAIIDVSHLQRRSHLECLSKIITAEDSSDNDKYVAETLLKNASIAAEMEYPGCQDTGTAIVMAKKGQNIYTGINDAAAISEGIWQAYQDANLRYSQTAPISMYEEVNTKNNLPAQIDISAVNGSRYEFLFVTKGGGSSNKTFLFQETKALLTPEKLMPFLKEKIASIGTSACPPYHLAVVIGGTSPEMNLKTVKLASAKYYDDLPESGNGCGRAFRDKNFEAELLDMTKNLGIGAQFGGKYFCHDVRVIRLPRHGASCPVGLGVSCSADRNIKAKITEEGLFLEKLETNPARFIQKTQKLSSVRTVQIDLDEGLNNLRLILSGLSVGTRVMLSGNIIVARDIAHNKLNERLSSGEGLPQYFKDHIIYYAGPAKTPDGRASGSFGPTTASRMDPYVPDFQKAGASLVMLAKGNRSQIVVDSCMEYGGFFLGTIGGAAAIVGRDCISEVELLEYPELGMEAIYKIRVKNFPAFLVVDDKGNDFYKIINEQKQS
ncbi:MAG: FumA C-terminus/TtdB family hydratase beta subunit [Spirochaetales bacterium]|nr:FumA C-terminus/TtdB family hydratase beta subunit [Spirochaetales bacterium]